MMPTTPLIVTGGIGLDEISDYLNNGADAVQLGTIFMLCQESNLPRSIKEYIIAKQTTRFTKYLTGRYARGVENLLMNELEGDYQYLFPLQHYATSELRKYARQNNLPEYMSLWAGSNPKNLQILQLETLIELIKNIT